MPESISKTSHIPVLLHEVIEGLNIRSDDVVVDGTINGAGHSEAIAKILEKDGVLIGIDLDKDALAKAKDRLKDAVCSIHLIEESYHRLDTVLEELSIEKVDKILLDLGMSSNQLDSRHSSSRGFSFLTENPLFMTFKSEVDEKDITAGIIVNTWSEEHISNIIYGYGEERFAKKIAKKIVEEREEKLIETTFDLVEIVKKAVPSWYQNKKIHFATRTFQALRIAVNDEIEILKKGLEIGEKYLCSEGRIAIISYHSIEDRVVKNYFRDIGRTGKGVVITKKPIVSDKEEIEQNPRSRSAKLRIFEKK